GTDSGRAGQPRLPNLGYDRGQDLERERHPVEATPLPAAMRLKKYSHGRADRGHIRWAPLHGWLCHGLWATAYAPQASLGVRAGPSSGCLVCGIELVSKLTRMDKATSVPRVLFMLRVPQRLQI